LTDLDDTTRALADRLGRRAGAINPRVTSIDHVRRRAGQRQQRRSMAFVVGAAGSVVTATVIVARMTSDRDQVVGPASSATALESSPTTVFHPGNVAAPLLVPLSRGSSGDAVVELQRRLSDIGFYPGPADGQFDVLTEQAVWAFEGLALARPWNEQTGLVDDVVWQLVHQDARFAPQRAGPGTHVEVYLDLQTLVVFTDDAPSLITHISSGTGETWCALLTIDTDELGQPLPAPQQTDVCGVSKTPGGVFEFYRRHEGNQITPLGGMYNPLYFNYGLAVYGANDVPGQPASHGGIRIPMAIADVVPSLVADNDLIYTWDGTKEPEQQEEQDMLPIFTYPNPDSTTTTMA
jgi:hypothetical protein